jgi:hypothetical protein
VSKKDLFEEPEGLRAFEVLFGPGGVGIPANPRRKRAPAPRPATHTTKTAPPPAAPVTPAVTTSTVNVLPLSGEGLEGRCLLAWRTKAREGRRGWRLSDPALPWWQLALNASRNGDKGGEKDEGAEPR